MIAVRRASPDDASAISRLVWLSWSQRFSGNMPQEVRAQADPENAEPQWRRDLADPPSLNHVCLVATDDDDSVAGVAVLAPDEQHGFAIGLLEVAPGHRGQGHGSRLMNACVDAAREWGTSTLYAWIWPDDAAFWEAAGWAPRFRTADSGPDVWWTEISPQE
ncbi:MAG: hypothetical protein RJB01_745 [Actinomycetota bacterium]